MTNIGLIGCGYWGPNLLRNLMAIPNCTVKTICDFNIDRLIHIQSLYPNLDITTEFYDIINNDSIDAVVIATPVSTHHPLAMKSLTANKHTFIEKPLALSSGQCIDLLQAAEERNLTLMVGHTFIYSSTVQKIKEIIESGLIGNVIYISSRRLNLGLFQKDINSAWDLGPHDISIILYLLNESPISVNCTGKAHINPDIEDVTNITLNYSNGGFATIQSSWIDPRKIREMTIVGTKKMIVYDDIEPLEKIKIYDKRVETPPHYDTFAEFHYSYHYGDLNIPYIKQSEPLRIECEHFLSCIEDGSKSLSSGMEGLKVVEILEAASKSLKSSGASIELLKKIYNE